MEYVLLVMVLGNVRNAMAVVFFPDMVKKEIRVQCVLAAENVLTIVIMDIVHNATGQAKSYNHQITLFLYYIDKINIYLKFIQGVLAMKRLLCIFVLLISMLLLSSCGTPKCKFSGCEDAATNGDYCNYHAKLQQLDSAAKSVFDYFFGD